MNANILNHDPMLPVGDKPFWDRNVSSEEEVDDLQSVADSFVLWKSLKQSRDRWLFHTFPKFSGKGRGSKNTIDTPHNNKQVRGQCDLEIGPHIFEETTFYEIRYLPPPTPNATPVQNLSSTSQWQSNVPYGSSYSYSAPLSNAKSTTINAATPASQPIATFTPLVPTLVDPSVPSALVTQVNLAASTNPTLSNLLQRAAARTATTDELQRLSLFIQSLASMPAESALAASNPAPISQPAPEQTPSNPNITQYQSTSQPPPPVREFDLVIEFRETSGDRWLVPKSCRPTASQSGSDVTLTICLYGTGETPSIPCKRENPETAPDDIADLPVSLLIRDAPADLWDLIVRWIGGEENMKANREYQESLVPPKRLYLGLQLPQGPLLTQLQTSVVPQYNSKPLKQGPAAPSRRAPRQKNANAQARASNQSNSTATEPPAGGVIKKRSRAPTVKPSPPIIHCITCKQTDVPLILGGRFCRPCVESGSYKTSMGQVPVPDTATPK